MKNALDAYFSVRFDAQMTFGAVIGCAVYFATYRIRWAEARLVAGDDLAKKIALDGFGVFEAGSAAIGILLGIYLALCTFAPEHLIELWSGKTIVELNELFLSDGRGNYTPANLDVRIELHKRIPILLTGAFLTFMSTVAFYQVSWKGRHVLHQH